MKLFIFILAVFISGCAHQLELISRNNSGNGNGTAQEAGKQITINLNGKTYKGTYVYDGKKTIQSFSSGTATASNGYQYANVYEAGSGVTYIPGSGNGKIIATSGDDTIRCDFNYSSGSGVGYCENNNGATFDLLIK